MAIIGISGKAGVGKDLVGQIIQYLTNNFDKSTNQPFRINDNYSINNSWKIVKFADKLKDIVCLLIGCTRQQLEDRNFKEKDLGEEWWIKTITYIDGGKHTIVNPTFSEELDLKSKYPISYNISTTKFTPRMLLQQIGTDLFRKQLHPSCWINATMTDYKIKYFISDVDELGCEETVTTKEFPVYPNWIITDVRFPNEAKAIKDRGGINIRINRPCKECSGLGFHKLSCSIGKLEHESETALDNYEFDYVIDNSGSIDDLIIKVKEILIKEGIL